MGCHGCSALTCLTAQNSVGVTAVHTPPPDFLRAQLDALHSDLPCSSVKIGMLGTSETIESVAGWLSSLPPSSRPAVVLDPVMIATSGARLISEGAQADMVSKLFPHATLLTPNKYEAEALCGYELRSPLDVERAASDILSMGCEAVLLKGGHTLSSDPSKLEGDKNSTAGYAQDYFLDASGGTWLRSGRYETDNTHGTGCTLSSAIASALALKDTEEVRRVARDRSASLSSPPAHFSHAHFPTPFDDSSARRRRAASRA